MVLSDELWCKCLSMCLLRDTTMMMCYVLRCVCKKFRSLCFPKVACLQKWPELACVLALLPGGHLFAHLESPSLGWLYTWRRLQCCEQRWRQDAIEDILETRSLLSEDWHERQEVGHALAAVRKSTLSARAMVHQLWDLCEQQDATRQYWRLLLCVDLTEEGRMDAEHLVLLQHAAETYSVFAPIAGQYSDALRPVSAVLGVQDAPRPDPT